MNKIRPSIRDVFDKIFPQNKDPLKEAIIRKISMALKYMGASDLEIPKEITLNYAFECYGKAQAMLTLLDEIYKDIQNASYIPFSRWPQELWNLRENSKKKVDLCYEMIRAIIYQQEKLLKGTCYAPSQNKNGGNLSSQNV